MRSGVIAQKLGMTRSSRTTVSMCRSPSCKVDNCQVVAQRTAEKDGYTAVQLGVGTAKVKNVSKAERGHFAKAQGRAEAKLAEFRVAEDALHRRRRRDHRRPLRRRPVGRRHRHHDRQGLRRRHEALELRRSARHARRLGLAPLASVRPAAPGSGQDVQEQEDGRPHGRRARHDAEPASRADRCRARPDPGRGRGSRLEGRLDPRARRRQARAAEGRAEARRVPHAAEAAAAAPAAAEEESA